LPHIRNSNCSKELLSIFWVVYGYQTDIYMSGDISLVF
jgi:hypothetical protein